MCTFYYVYLSLASYHVDRHVHIQHDLDNLCNRPTERNYYIRGYIQSDRRPVLIMNYMIDNHAGDWRDRRPSTTERNCNDRPTNRALQYEITTTDRTLQHAVQRPTRTDRALQQPTAERYNAHAGNDRPTDRTLLYEITTTDRAYSTKCTDRPTDRPNEM